MSIAFGTQPLFALALGSQLNAQPNGTYTVSLPDGEVLSVQPDGTQQKRPSGTAGPYEVCSLIGNVLVFNPAGTPFAFAYFGTVPNA